MTLYFRVEAGLDTRAVHDDLVAIRALMTESQRLVRGTWSHQLVWGILATVGLTATWAVQQAGRYEAILPMWLGLVVVGWTFSIVRGRRYEQAPVRNAATRAFGGIWIGLGVTLTLIGLVTIPTGAVRPGGLPGVLAAVLGAGYFASGFLAGLRWMLFVGLGWWLGAFALLLWQGPSALLALAGLTVAFEVIPALAFRKLEGSSDAVA